MNRRKAIFRIMWGGAGIAGLAGGYQWWKLNRTPDLAWLEDNQPLIGALAETIIPATDSPGALETGVARFIVKMITHCTPVHEQNTFIDGLKDLRHYCHGSYGKPYSQCTIAQQDEVMAYFEQKGKPLHGLPGKLELRFKGRSFFQILKAYTVEGYCTSEPGATKGLAYLYIPGSFHGCVPLQPNQRTWATN